jgi:hypothetical protein
VSVPGQAFDSTGMFDRQEQINRFNNDTNQRPALGQTQSCIVVKPVNLFLTVKHAGGIKGLPRL